MPAEKPPTALPPANVAPTNMAPAAKPAASSQGPQWLALYFPNLPLDVFQQLGLPNEQVQLVIEERRVSHMNKAASAAGILAGCSLATAHSISAELEYFERSPEQEQQRLADLAQALYRYSSMVSLEPPDCIVLEIGASRQLWGNAATITQHALNLCADMNHLAVGRQAATPQAAIALARAQTTRLYSVPLHVLELLNQGFSQRNLERLSNMGIYTLGQLIQLPRAGLGKRFGQCLTQYLGRLQGQLPDPRQGIRPAAHFLRQQHLFKPISNKAVLLRGPMPYLAKQLEHWLIAHQQGCIGLNWTFAPFKGQAVTLPMRFGGGRFGRGKQQHQDMLKLSALQLENSDLPKEVLTIGLEMTLGQPWLGHNQDLFGSTASHTMAANELVDELSARLGADACYGIRSKSQHSPEQAWQGVTGLSASISASGPSAHTASSSDPAATSYRSAGLIQGERPLWLFQQPQRIASAELILLQGPERLIDPTAGFGHRNSAPCQRDYYIARHAQGALCWVYTESPSLATDTAPCWYLHGYFA